MIESTVNANSADELRKHLFYETSHSPALTDLVGYEKAKDIVDFCFIANPYYPTAGMLEDLQRSLPNLIKSYPSSNPLMSQKHLAAVLNVDPERLIIGNGATELITLIKHDVDRPDRGAGSDIRRVHREDEGLAGCGAVPARSEGPLPTAPGRLSGVGAQAKSECLLVINPGNPTGQFIPLEEMVEFLHRARDLELVIVDESFIDFAGDPIPSLLAAGRPVYESADCAQHEQALRGAGTCAWAIATARIFTS